ncbi:MAG: hypothetical protein HY819_00250 [Acidobacteria bacterium]|nr:hypothetical protein [Acidobacteriota bacterium]
MSSEEKQLDSPKNILGKIHLELVVSIILFLAGLSEAYESLDNDLKYLSLKGHHGIIIFGLFNTFKAIVEVKESYKKIKKERNSNSLIKT